MQVCCLLESVIATHLWSLLVDIFVFHWSFKQRCSVLAMMFDADTSVVDRLSINEQQPHGDVCVKPFHTKCHSDYCSDCSTNWCRMPSALWIFRWRIPVRHLFEAYCHSNGSRWEDIWWRRIQKNMNIHHWIEQLSRVVLPIPEFVLGIFHQKWLQWIADFVAHIRIRQV